MTAASCVDVKCPHCSQMILVHLRMELEPSTPRELLVQLQLRERSRTPRASASSATRDEQQAHQSQRPQFSLEIPWRMNHASPQPQRPSEDRRDEPQGGTHYQQMQWDTQYQQTQWGTQYQQPQGWGTQTWQEHQPQRNLENQLEQPQHIQHQEAASDQPQPQVQNEGERGQSSSAQVQGQPLSSEHTTAAMAQAEHSSSSESGSPRLG